uniref:Protein-glutamine gamma-glutamyltransferase 2 n=1 Tax=Poecilia reticulata TaxID=8081 RepID=A0A3P9QH46_POERE
PVFVVFRLVDLHSDTNNNEHHTSEISVTELIVRRGQAFKLTLKLSQPFNLGFDQLIMTVVTGWYPSEDLGTKSRFGVPGRSLHSASAKAVWKAELQRGSSPETGVLVLIVSPPADAPIGEYTLSASFKDKEKVLANFSVLFNPWSSDDWVFLPKEEERREYVLNEQGIIYRGGGDYISPMFWDFGQFEQGMVKICLKMLDLNVKYWLNPADDVSARCSPIYVSRVVSAMINSSDEGGVVMGNWGNDYSGGFPPTYWSGSYAILKQWYNSYYRSVRYGQCWVFAGVMCSVMRLLGIPCRVVSNFQSAHDTNKNLTIDNYFDNNGAMERESKDSIWNFHVWVEGWMRRPDLAKDGKYDGWQVVDPTPQERSEGLFCCGPASVTAIRNGEVDLKYDVPFVFAEVNADSVYCDGSRTKIFSDTETVGQNISTKAVGSYKRVDLTNTYKHREGGLTCMDSRGRSVSKPENGKDVNLKMIVSSDTSTTRTFSVSISVQAMKYTGQPEGNIQTEVTEQKLGLRLFVMQVSGGSKVNQELTAEVVFTNPIDETLSDCSMSLSGSGLMIGQEITKLPNLRPNCRFRVAVVLVPYKTGERSLLVNFSCSSFKDIKSSCIVNIKP